MQSAKRCGYGITLGAKQLDRKLEPLWKGPAVLIKQLTNTMWRIRMPRGRATLSHTDTMQPYVE